MFSGMNIDLSSVKPFKISNPVLDDRVKRWKKEVAYKSLQEVRDRNPGIASGSGKNGSSDQSSRNMDVFYRGFLRGFFKVPAEGIRCHTNFRRHFL